MKSSSTVAAPSLAPVLFAFFTPFALLVLLVLLVLLGIGRPSFASPGHDHDHDHDHDHADAAPAAGHTASNAAPARFAAISETFELVGLLDGQHITLYLDRFADNTPVHDAQIELEIAGNRFKAQKVDGELYRVTLQQTPGAGELAIKATVSTGAVAELLAGELDLHEAAHTAESAEPAEPAHGHTWRPWQERAGWAAGGLLALALLALGARRVMAARQLRAGGAA